MSLKNYYATLGIPQTASDDEVRTAFRRLAKKYHPDKAQDNPFAETHFKELQEAYEVLSDAAKRTSYDKERWLRGLNTRRKAAVIITPEWVLGEAVRLRRHMANVDTYHMNHAALRDYVIALLSAEHLSVLQQADHFRTSVLEEVFASMQHLHHAHTSAVTVHLKLLAGADANLNLKVARWEKERIREAKWNVYRPWIVLFATILMCLIIWWLK